MGVDVHTTTLRNDTPCSRRADASTNARGSELRGHLTKHDDTATFVSEDGDELRYENEGEFRTLECVLSKMP